MKNPFRRHRATPARTGHFGPHPNVPNFIRPGIGYQQPHPEVPDDVRIRTAIEDLDAAMDHLAKATARFNLAGLNLRLAHQEHLMPRGMYDTDTHHPDMLRIIEIHDAIRASRRKIGELVGDHNAYRNLTIGADLCMVANPLEYLDERGLV